MKLPQTIVLAAKRKIQVITTLLWNHKRLTLLSLAVVLCFALLVPLIKQPKPDSKAVLTPPPQAKISIPAELPQTAIKPVPVQQTKQTSTKKNEPVKAVNSKFLSPLKGKVLRGTSKDVIWWDILGDYRQHVGVDLEAAAGSAVKAAGSGVVTELGADPVYGNVLVIDHGGNWKTVYGQLAEISVHLNDKVEAGQEVGKLAPPSAAEEDMPTHLHYELWLGQEIKNGK